MELGMGKEMHFIDYTFHPNSLAKSTSMILKHWIGKIRKKNIVNDKELYYLLKNDQRKNIIIHSICDNKNKSL